MKVTQRKTPIPTPHYQLTYINTYSTFTLTPIHTIYTHRHPHPSYPSVDVGVSPLRHTPHPHIHLPHPTSDPPYTNSVCDTMYLDHRVNCAKVVLHLLSSIILTKGHFLQKAHFQRTFYLRTFRSKDIFERTKCKGHFGSRTKSEGHFVKDIFFKDILDCYLNKY